MKKFLVTMFTVALMIVLVACGGNKVDDATAEKHSAHAEEIIGLLNDGNYEEVHSQFDEIMKLGLPVVDLEDLTPIIDESGTFEKIDKASVEEEEGMYITVLTANYSEENRVYTITFDGNDKVAGLYIK